MKKNYHQLDIDFEPNSILQGIYNKEQLSKPLVENITDINHLSSNIICDFSTNTHTILDFLFSSSNYLDLVKF